MSQSEMDRHFNSRRALKKRIEELAREVTHLRRVEQAAREAIREHNCGDIEACYVCGPLDRALAPRSERREGEPAPSVPLDEYNGHRTCPVCGNPMDADPGPCCASLHGTCGICARPRGRCKCMTTRVCAPPAAPKEEAK